MESLSVQSEDPSPTPSPPDPEEVSEFTPMDEDRWKYPTLHLLQMIKSLVLQLLYIYMSCNTFPSLVYINKSYIKNLVRTPAAALHHRFALNMSLLYKTSCHTPAIVVPTNTVVSLHQYKALYCAPKWQEIRTFVAESCNKCRTWL